MIISLTGFMGCGKSSVGRRLSELLCCSFVDLDSVIEEREGRSIPEIFASEGESHFRYLEKAVLSGIISANTERQVAPLAPSHFVGPSPYAGVRKCQFRKTASPQVSADMIPDRYSSQETNSCETVAPEETLVVALGGGTVMTAECAEMVKSETLCIYLRASVDTIARNLEGEAAGRPMLQSGSNSGQNSVKAAKSEESGSPAKQLRERIESLMSQRSETYENTAHIIIDTDGRTVDSIAQEIRRIYLSF